VRAARTFVSPKRAGAPICTRGANGYLIDNEIQIGSHHVAKGMDASSVENVILILLTRFLSMSPSKQKNKLDVTDV
jgi:hypothetical protein